MMNEKAKIKLSTTLIRSGKLHISCCGYQNHIEKMVEKMAIQESENKHKYIGCVFPKKYLLDKEE